MIRLDFGDYSLEFVIISWINAAIKDIVSKWVREMLCLCAE